MQRVKYSIGKDLGLPENVWRAYSRWLSLSRCTTLALLESRTWKVRQRTFSGKTKNVTETAVEAELMRVQCVDRIGFDVGDFVRRVWCRPQNHGEGLSWIWPDSVRVG